MNRKLHPRKGRPRPNGKNLSSTLALMAAGLLFITAMGFAFSTGQLQSQSKSSKDDPPASSSEKIGFLGPRRAPTSSEGTLPAKSDEPIELHGFDGAQFDCSGATVTDGDTLRCGDRRVRLAGIDAPELPGHCRRGRQCVEGDPYASASNLEQLISSNPLSCIAIDTDAYGRTVAFCASGSVDLSCAQLASGNAIQRYSSISCEGSRRL